MINFYPDWKNGSRHRVVMAIGVFDSVHLGHREILRHTVETAHKLDAEPVAVTFFPHPRQVVNTQAPHLLLPPDIRIKKLLENGMISVGTIDFTPQIAALEPEDFLDAITNEKSIDIVGIVVGEHWRFGKNGSGDRKLLDDYLKRRNISFVPVPEKQYRNAIISASRIRQCVASGDLDDAQAMLGYPVPLFGKIVHGYRDASNLLATPTANLQPVSEFPIPDGIYAGMAHLGDDSTCPAAVIIGYSPTFKRHEHRIEVHLLDFSGDLYGKNLQIDLLKFIRQERAFASIEDLKRQISVDLDEVASIYSLYCK